MKKRELMVLLAGGLILLSSSCSHSELHQRVALSGASQWQVDVKDLMTRRTEKGLLQAEADCLNDSFFTQNFEYKFEWYNAEGMLVKSHHSRWTKVTVDAGMPFRVQGVAPHAEVVNFKVFIRKQK